MVRTVIYRTCLLLFFHSVLVHAEVIPGRWEKVEAQAPGTGLTVVLKSGDRFDCTFEEVQMDTLVVETGTGERRIPKVDIQRLETSELVPDPVKDGLVKGAVIGAVVVGVFGGLVGSTGFESVSRFEGALALGAIGAGIGAGLGAAIGFTVDYVAKDKRPEVLYVAN